MSRASRTQFILNESEVGLGLFIEVIAGEGIGGPRKTCDKCLNKNIRVLGLRLKPAQAVKVRAAASLVKHLTRTSADITDVRRLVEVVALLKMQICMTLLRAFVTQRC